MTTITLRVHGRPSALLIGTFFAALLAAVALAAVLVTRDGASNVVEGSGVAVSQPRELPSFAAVELSGTAALTVRVGREQRVVVTADDNLVDVVATRVQSRTLVVATRDGSFRTMTPMHVDVTVPALDSATLSGTGAITIDGVEAPVFRLRLSGTGLVTVGGTVGRLETTLDGTGEARLEALVARDVLATLVGSGRLAVHATRSLTGTLRGTGAIVYTGDPPRVMREISGTGAIVEG